MGSFHYTPQNSKHKIKMKVQFILAACLVAAAFAAPIDNFVDPDCIEEDLVVEEPSQEIDADFALGLPDLRLEFGNNEPEEDCVDDIVPTEPQAAPAATEECEDPIETTPEPTTAEECVEEETEPAPEADECAEEDTNEVAPALNIRIEPAAVVEDIKVYGEESMIPDIEECEE